MRFNRFLGVAAALAAAVMMGWVVPADEPLEVRHAMIIFVAAAILWAFELIPLYATSLAVVIASTLCFSAQTGKPFEFASLFASPIIFLFLGGFVLASMFHKYHIDRLIVDQLLGWFGTKPFFVLLGLILSTGFLSLWMSNTATTAIMLTTIRPILSSMDGKDPFRKALALSIPFAANIGGIGTPIGTPPNAIAISLLESHGIEINFLKWMLMAVPLALAMLLSLAIILFVMFPTTLGRIPYQSLKMSLPREGRWVSCVAIATIVLWLTSEWHRIPESHVALFAIALFSGAGFLTRDDLNRLDWDILVLMWGGLALGRAMEVSGFANWIISFPFFEQQGFFLVAIFSLLTVAISIFMSNTAAANLMLPLALTVGGDDRTLLAVMVALASSFDMILPISTPPNAMAFATHEFSSTDMLKSGLIVILIAIVLLLIGYPFFIRQILLGA